MLIRNIPTHYMEKREKSTTTSLTLFSCINLSFCFFTGFAQPKEIELAGGHIKILVFFHGSFQAVSRNVHQIEDSSTAGALEMGVIFHERVIAEVSLPKVQLFDEIHLAKGL